MEDQCNDATCDVRGEHPVHTPETRSTSWYNNPARFFKRMPGGGTVYVQLT